MIPLAAALTGAVGAMSAIMAGAWRVQRITGNSGWIDTIWSLGTGAVAFSVALLPIAHDGAPDWRQAAAAACAACWSLRLGLHIGGRTQKVADDPRYRAKLDAWGDKAASRLFWFLQAQALVGLILVAAVALAAHRRQAEFGALDGLALLVFALGLGCETLADAQLRRFKHSSPPHGAVCDVGLWSWSRHPNYFGEWLCWCGVALLAIGTGNPAGWLALLAPAVMYWTLVHASGIPPLEAHMMQSRPQAFAAYKRRTSAFFPLPPKR